MRFVERETERSAGDNVAAIIGKMVEASLQADAGGGKKVSIYRSYHNQIVRAAPSRASDNPIEPSAWAVEELQRQANSKIYDRMASAAARFDSELEKLALILYIKAKNPKNDIEGILTYQKNSLSDAAVSWGRCANFDAVFPNNPDYSGSPQRIPNMLKAVEAAMQQSLRDQKIGQDIQVTPY